MSEYRHSVPFLKPQRGALVRAACLKMHGYECIEEKLGMLGAKIRRLPS